MKVLSVGLLLILVFALSCKEKPTPAKVPIDMSSLTQSWTHSFEEESDSIALYRPSDYKNYPGARYRDNFDLQNDGSCNYMVLSPDDAHYSVRGTWSVRISDGTIVELRDTLGNIHYVLKVVELRSDLLRILKLQE